jgi:hypothetical protein
MWDMAVRIGALEVPSGGMSTGVVCELRPPQAVGGHRDLPAGGDKRLPGRRPSWLRNVARARSSMYEYPSIGADL